MTRYIFITGGVASSLGKGIASAALGALLQARGYSVKLRKLDPYLNVDPGTMSPFQHGEVFVTEDGTETDLDLGHYERFTDVNSSVEDNITTGQIYNKVIERERKGDYLGGTVQIIPHVTDQIKEFILNNNRGVDFCLCEIGGTVGDIEGLPFFEAIRQLGNELPDNQTCFVHLTLVPYIAAAVEIKTKPTQHSVSLLRAAGISPDVLVLRSDRELNDEIKSKVSLFCDVSVENVIHAPDLDDIYEVPLRMYNEGLDQAVNDRLHLNSEKPDLDKWQTMVNLKLEADKTVKIAILGKYFGLPDSYLSVVESLKHACLQNKAKLDLHWIDADNFETEILHDIDGVIVPGGFGYRGIEGKISAIEYIRKNIFHFWEFVSVCSVL